MSRRPLLRLVWAGVWLAGAVMASGCDMAEGANEVVEQPLEFSHAKHLRYFLGGSHRAENLKRHVGDADPNEAPVELLEGRCLECHEAFDAIPDCAGCHRVFQDERARADRARRPCLGCHRAAWTGYRAGIPAVDLCKSCHAKTPRTQSEQEKVLRTYIATARDIPWRQVGVLDESVEFPHVAHVRLANLGCTSCHPLDVGRQSQPQPSRLSMRDCVTCHEQRNADISCLACHK